jgi:hypothetical protein
VFLLIAFSFFILLVRTKFKNIIAYENPLYSKLFLFWNSTRYPLIICSIALLVALSIYFNWKQNPAVDVNLARSYLDAQLWAYASSDPKAVFMPDPGMPLYGRAWSEYSRRASFGTVRDWLHVPIAYHANLDGFKEGVRRLSLLGINPYSYKESAFSLPCKNPMLEHAKTIDAARVAYYSMSSERLIEIADKERIDFFIFSKNYSKPHPKLKSVYENKHFIIYSPTADNS